MDMNMIENRTFDELQVGESASLVRTLTMKDIDLFAIISGDINPAYLDEEYARSDMFHKIIAHGMWGASLISTVLGARVPIILTSRADSPLAHKASCVLALLLAHSKRRAKP